MEEIITGDARLPGLRPILIMKTEKKREGKDFQGSYSRKEYTPVKVSLIRFYDAGISIIRLTH